MVLLLLRASSLRCWRWRGCPPPDVCKPKHLPSASGVELQPPLASAAGIPPAQRPWPPSPSRPRSDTSGCTWTGEASINKHGRVWPKVLVVLSESRRVWDLTLSVWSWRFSPAGRRGSGLGPDLDWFDWSGSRYTEPVGRNERKTWKDYPDAESSFTPFNFFMFLFLSWSNDCVWAVLAIHASKHSTAMNFGLSNFYPFQIVTYIFP